MEQHDDASAEARGWAVINAHAHRERVAVENLERQGFRVYCPLIRKTVRHARRVQDVARPLFPGYLFLRAGVDAGRWRPALSTIGVRSLLRFGDRPGYVDDRFIQSLRARERDGVIVAPVTPYRVGQQVKIVGGAFDGLVATILELRDEERVTVLMEMLSGEVKVRLETRNLALTA
jgi:transcriptional antiterminator RfaH